MPLSEVHAFLGSSDSDKRQPIKPRKLRPFSGAKSPAAGELEYKWWRLQAVPIVDDPFLRNWPSSCGGWELPRSTWEMARQD